MKHSNEGNAKEWLELYQRSGQSLVVFAQLLGVSYSTAKKYRYNEIPINRRAVYGAKYALIRLGLPVDIDLVDWTKIRTNTRKS